MSLASAFLDRLPLDLDLDELAALGKHLKTHGVRSLPIAKAWEVFSKVPGGKRAFSKLVGKAAPYTGTIGAEVLELGPGFARVRLEDRPGLRNHLESVHAIALANLGEMTTGLAMMYGLSPDARGIVTAFHVDYVKKARGTLTCECRTEPELAAEEQAVQPVGEIRDASGEVVARATATWLIRPR